MFCPSLSDISKYFSPVLVHFKHKMPDKRNDKSPLHNPRTLRSKSDTCRICKDTVDVSNTDNSSEKGVSCSGCNYVFHLTCGGVSHTFYTHYILQQRKPWYCYLCDSELRQAAAASVKAIKKIEETAAKVNSDVQILASEIQILKNNESSWRQEFECRIDDSINHKIEAKFAELNRNQASSNFNTHSAVPETAVGNSSYRKNLVINGVPENGNENVVHVIKKIAKQINFTQANFIDNCYRIEKKGERDTMSVSKPATILLKFTTELARDGFFKCYFTYLEKRKLCPADIELEGHERIYVNEHMNPKLQPLLKKALSLRRAGKIEQVATHSAYLSIKIASGNRSKWFRIIDEEALNALFGSEEANTDSVPLLYSF